MKTKHGWLLGLLGRRYFASRQRLRNQLDYGLRVLKRALTARRGHCRNSSTPVKTYLFASLFLTCLFLFAAVRAEAFTAPAESLPTDPGWPRQYTDGIATLELSQPQVDSWPDFKKLKARFAAKLIPAKGAQPEWGVLLIESDTDVDIESRTVALENFKVTGAHYPSAKDEAQAKEWEALTTRLLPGYPTTLALDRILAYMDEKPAETRQTAVLLEPPPILVSTQPAVLVIIDGQPVRIDLGETGLQKIVNTNWDLFFDKKEKRYYLRDGMSWLMTSELNDKWVPTTKLAKSFSKLPDRYEYKDITKAVARPEKTAIAKQVFVVYKPSELIALAGEPLLQPIPDTHLMWVSNTDSDLFFDNEARQFFFLTSGRWFKTADLKTGKWSTATTSLPEDFKKIPPDHPSGHVLAAVPGTPQAEDAVLTASIPQIATVDRHSIKAEVQYVGDPKFEPIEGTAVSYATNTPNDVLQFENRYYLCLEGVWFVSNTAKGPWAAADSIPKQIYEIPPSSPKYNVTYVTVYDSTPTTVTYGYTAGYTGVYIGYGVAMWGTGYYYPPYYGYGYYPIYWPYPYYTYGASVWYNPATGAYGRGSAVYGPYGGYARGGAYNPSTGAYAWGQSAWGPYGAAASGGFYNPNTGTWGGSYRASNGYQSWGQSVVGRGNQWARTASYADERGAVGAIKGSGGAKAVVGRGEDGRGFVGKSAAGDFYAGRDGNVYKRDQASGQWYKNNGGSWDAANGPRQPGQLADAGDRGTLNKDAGHSLNPGTQAAGIQRSLNRDAAARAQGNYNTRMAESARRNSARSAGSSTAPRSTGFSSRSRSFGRRR